MRVLSKSPLGWCAKLASLKMWWWKVLLQRRFLHKKKNWISDFTRKKGLDFIPTTQKQSNGIGSWVEMGKVAKEEEGIEEVFKYLLLYNTTSAQHIHDKMIKKCSAGFIFYIYIYDIYIWYIYITKNKINLLNLF